VERLLCLAIGYVFGTFQTAVLYGKIKGVDIRKVGSGNAGTTNTLRVLGAKAGFTVLFGDMIKCLLAVTLVRFLFANNDLKYLLMIYTAAGCVLGHDFPFFLRFKGGKGIAVTAGNCIAFGWQFVLAGLLSFLIPFNITHYVSLGSLVLYTVFFLQMVFMGQTGHFVGLSQSNLAEMYLIVLIMTILAFYQHRANIKRLLTGSERKTYIFKKNKVD